MHSNKAALWVAAVVTTALAFVAGYWLGQRSGQSSRSYPSQAVVVTGLALAAPAKIAVTAFHADNGHLPSSNAAAGLPAAERIADRYVSSIAIGPQGVITITYQGEPLLQGKTLVMTPTVLAGDYAITWSCSGGTLPVELRPEACR
jgi:type IV pilus assembly protein PilA